MPEAQAIDNERSQVILSSFGLQLWINRAGHLARDTAQHEREEFLDELSQYLLADSDPITGEAIIRAVHRGRHVFDGPFAKSCPDLIIEYNNLFDTSGPGGETNSLTEGGHTSEGILLAQGPAIATARSDGARLVDLAPTILYLLDLPVPPDMDGTVLEPLLTSQYIEHHQIRIGDEPARLAEQAALDEMSDDQDAELRDQFRQLGYL